MWEKWIEFGRVTSLCERMASTSVFSSSISTIKVNVGSGCLNTGANVNLLLQSLKACVVAKFHFNLVVPPFNREVRGTAMDLSTVNPSESQKMLECLKV